MTRSLRDAVEDMLSALNAGELEQAYEVLAEECVLFSPMGVVNGKDAIRAADSAPLEQLDMHWRRLERMIVSGDDVAFWLTFGGTVKATRKSFETEVCNVLRFADGRVIEWRSYADWSSAAQAWT